jgi:Skp family chaperone for outer membrane proteins
VFDKSGKTLNEVPSVVFSQDTMDVTDDVLKVLNKNAPKTEP